MSTRKRNLLEAFRDAAPDAREPVRRKGKGAPVPGGPFAGGSGASAGSAGGAGAGSGAPSAPNEPPTAHGDPAQRAPALRRRKAPTGFADLPRERLGQLALVQVVLLSIAFYVGRASIDPAHAAGTIGNDSSLASGPGVVPLGGPLQMPVSDADDHADSTGDGPASPATTVDLQEKRDQVVREGTPDDREFYLNPDNQVTVRIIQYQDDERGRGLASEAYRYLRREGLPAIWPIKQGQSLLLCVGAQPRIADLKGLRDYVANLRGPSPKSNEYPFQSAYIVNIDDVVLR